MSKKPRVSHYVYPSSGNQEERIIQALYGLELDGIISSFKQLAKLALEKHSTHYDFLDSILEAQYVWKEGTRVPAQILAAKFPYHRTIEGYDFSIPRKIDEAKVREFASCRFIDRGENVIFVGPTGVGKTHLSVAVGHKAIDYGKKVRYYKVIDLIDQIEKTTVDELEKQRRLLGALSNYHLLILDDMESIETTPAVSDFLYRLLLARYEKPVSTIFTANESFTEWDKIFGKQIRAEKIADRVLEHSHTVEIDGESQRIKDKLNIQKQNKSKGLAISN